ncbi:PorP/SprF family type IX secretion system membrane protein [Flavilitoribacter nigricans]|uniref:Type IX secretion system membrane protein PorP/SprF n=1 Tax=Flavilitoribacter nigricans (strain ATCC 23147 / DSM 23189 / NBRC 102662 / NCIMB 1420 / SS-2) TaxID=1122177 RepID=A0A2D0NFY2_FLAN2|nr:PorP/SprF family type IX secretion system membrane protein [Flavilitoribacter nigricans]PHN07412.1 hypothetical protein CRP01_07220 [Flavilitoribacter nigricans DSM 23189 = NBRC 102662]
MQKPQPSIFQAHPGPSSFFSGRSFTSDRHISLVLLISLVSAFSLSGQQLSQRSPFSENSFIWNPAMTAPWDYWEMGVNYRQEWLGFQDAPRTATLQVQYPFERENMSLGGYFVHDNASPVTMNSASFAYAYRMQLDRRRGGRQLSLGLNATLSHIYVNALEIVTNDPDDAVLPAGENNKISPNLGFGVFYTSYSKDEFERTFFFGGLAINQVLPLSVILDDFGGSSNLMRALHGNVILGTRIVNGDIYIQPSAWVNYSAPNIVEANLNFKLEQQEAFWAGLNYSTTQTIGLQAGVILNNDFTRDGTMRIGTAGTFNVGQFGKFRGMGFEFYLAYQFEM